MHHSQPQVPPSEDTLFNETAGIDSLEELEAKLAQAKEDLDKLFVDNEVVLLKTNPVNHHLSPFWKTALAPIINYGSGPFKEGVVL